MKFPNLQQKAAVIAVVLWFLVGLAGAHGHFCFDGQEPLISVHMDVMGEHPQHQVDEQHVDADVELGQSIAAKVFKVDLPLVLVAALLLILLMPVRRRFSNGYPVFYPSKIIRLRPPMRAPPVIPA